MTVDETTLTQTPPENTQDDSFLTEDQLEGKAQGDINLLSLDEAIENVSNILDPNVVNIYKNTPEEEWPTCKMEVYNHELKQIVPAGIGQTLKGNPRTVCGLTGSKKISIGKKEALEKYYHIQAKDKATTIEDAKKTQKQIQKQNAATGKSKK